MSNASNYADGIAKDIRARYEAGSVFGWINRETEEWEGDEPKDWSDDVDSPWSEAGALDYLSDVLDIEYRVDSENRYRSALVLIAFGGPNAWIDTKARELIVAWGGEHETRTLPLSFIDGIDAALEELRSL